MAQPHPAPVDPQLATLRVPPHSIEAEQSVIGALLLDNSAWERIADVVAPDDFYRDDHRRIFKHVGKLIDGAKPADVVTVAESIEASEDKDKTGGIAYLGQLAQNTPSAHNVRRYAEIVRERAIMRRLIATASDIADGAFSPAGKDVAQLLDEAESKIFEIAEAGARGRTGFVAIQPLLAQVMERIDTLYHRDNPSDVTGVPTGFDDLDEMTSGLQEGDLIIVAGRPSMGKAQPLDARVKTLSGWKAMGDVAVGDALASVDGAPSIVTGVFPQGEREVFRVTFSDGRSTRCCAEHLWRVHHRAWPAPRILETSQVAAMLGRERYRHRLWIDVPSGSFGHRDSLPVDPWVLGALLGDGDLTQDSIRFSSASEEMMLRLRARLAEELLTVAHAGHYDYRIVREDRCRVAARVGHSGNPLNRALRALGLLGCRSHDKFVPRAYLDANPESRLDLLRGLLDTDGWVKRRGSIRLSTASERLALDVAELVRSLGGWCTIRTKQPRSRATTGERNEGRGAFVCHIAHPRPADLLLLSEKATRLSGEPRRAKHPIFERIEPVGRAPVQCISVSHPSRLYVTDDYVVTHNTAFSLNIAEYVAVEQRLPVAVFSMEMSGSQLAMRMLGSIGRLDQHKLRTARLSDEDWGRLTNAVEKLHDAPIHIDETPALNALELRARSRRLHRQYGKLGLIVIDYLQLMSASTMGENRATEISEISRSLKALAKELHVPVIALSQLNRSLEQRPNKRPVMSDLRECVVGETPVLCADGRRVPIASLVGTRPVVWAVDEAGKVRAAEAEAVWSVGVKPVRRLHLASGRTLVATDRHRLLAGGGWKALSVIEPGERVALARRVPDPVSAVEWPEHALVLLGHLVGDGSYLKGQPLRYTTASEKNSSAVCHAAEALGSTVTRHPGRGAWHQLVIGGNGSRWQAAGVVQWLKSLGLFGQRSHEKHLPAEVFRLGERQVALLLRHLWATDGCIALRKPGQKGSPRVYFSSCSERLAADVAALLLRVGIVSRTRTVHRSGARPVFSVDVSGTEAQSVFLDKVGGFGPRAAQALALQQLLRLRGARTNVDSLPREAFAEVRARMSASGVTTRSMAAMRGTSYGGAAHFDFAPSRDVLREYAMALDDASLARWVDSDLFWDTVVRIEDAGEREVFDLTVPGPASWLADGIVSHNSGAIEQDADVIFFIYRDEVYNPDTADKGKAEIIIGKQRNGPIGTIDLTFLGQHTRFENYAAPNRF